MAPADNIQKRQNFRNDIISQVIPIRTNGIEIASISIFVGRIKYIGEK